MKKNLIQYIVGAVIVAAFVAYLIFFNSENSKNAVITGTIPSPTSTVTSEITTGTSAGTPPANGSSTVTAGQYKDGTYTGATADAFYGNLQVAAVIQGGKLTDVQLLQYPQDPGHTAEVNAMALPELQQEAIATQSAQVNVVSGATQTSHAFQQSLAGALAQAQ